MTPIIGQAQEDDVAQTRRGRLRRGPPLLLDGATGSELERRGYPCAIPLWSAGALLACPDLVEAIHRDYAAAGAEILTANTFRTQERTLGRAGLGGRAGALTRLAVERARAARAAAPPGRPIWIAGSIPPLEDCYRPDLVPDDAALAREHAEHATHLAAAGCDLLLIETINAIREGRAAAAAARRTRLPFWVSFCCDHTGRLLSGESLAAALAAVVELGAEAVGVNCLALDAFAAALPALTDAPAPFGVYPNLAPTTPRPGAPFHEAAAWRECSPPAFARAAANWMGSGARFLGGCCGTRPDHIRALATQLAAAEEPPQ